MMRLLEVKEYSEKYNKENEPNRKNSSVIFQKGFLTKEDLLEIINNSNIGYEKLIEKILEKIKNLDNGEIEDVTRRAFNSDEEKMLRLLTKLKGITPNIASYILTAYNPKEYCKFNSHIYDEVFGTNSETRPKSINSNRKSYLELLENVRYFSKKYEMDAVEIGNAFYQKSYEKGKLRTHILIKEISQDERPREKLEKLGPNFLSNEELLALILRTGHQKENAIDMSKKLIRDYGLEKLSDYSLKELQEIKGIGPAKSCQIIALFEFNKRHNMAKTPVKKITCAKDVFDYFHEKLKDKKQEEFWILLLSTQNIIIKEEFITKGILDAAILHPREVFKPAIKHSASRIILVHNHPSGNAKPSQEDLEITEQIIRVGKEIGIKVLDHVIIGDNSWWSWCEDK